MKKPPIKLLHVLNELKPSGAETMLESAGEFFKQQGLESHILSTGKCPGAFAPVLEKAGYTIHHIPFKRYAIFTSPLFLLEYFKFLRRERFEVVHVHPERANFLNSALARIVGARVVVRTVHHIFPQPWTLAGIFFRIVRSIQRQVMRRVFSVTIVSNSPSGQENERRTYFSSNLLIPNWYNDSRFKPCTEDQRKEARDSLGFDPDTFVIVSLGGNWVYKNYHLVVQALASLPKEMKVRYVQVGPQGEGNPLESLARTLGVSERLQCAGSVPDPVIYLHAADAFIMPSSVEGFGCAAAEAMGCGLPAILAHTPALKDFKEHCPGISFVQPEVESIVAAIRKLAALSREERFEIGSELSRQVSMYYGLNSGAAAYLKLYSQP